MTFSNINTINKSSGSASASYNISNSHRFETTKSNFNGKKIKLIDQIRNQSEISALSNLIFSDLRLLDTAEIVATFDTLCKIYYKDKNVKELSNNKNLIVKLLASVDAEVLSLDHRFAIFNAFKELSDNYKNKIKKYANEAFTVLFPGAFNIKSLDNERLITLMCYLSSLDSSEQDQLYQNICHAILNRDNLTPQQISLILQCHASKLKYNPTLFSHLGKLAINAKENFSIHEISVTLNSFTKLRVENYNLLDEFYCTLKNKNLNDAVTDDLLSILTSYLTFNPNKHVLSFINHLCVDSNKNSRLKLAADEKNEKFKKQFKVLFQIYLAATALNIDKEIVWPDIFIQKKDSFILDKQDNKLQSELNSLAYQFAYIKWEKEVQRGPYRLALFAPPPYKLTVEIDVLHHVRNGKQIYGQDFMKNWILKGLGYNIIRLPYNFFEQKKFIIRADFFNLINSAHKQNEYQSIKKEATQKISSK